MCLLVVLSAECVRSPPTLVCSVSRLRFLALAFRLFLSGNCLYAAIGRRFLSAFGHFPRAGRLRARPRKFHDKDLSHTQLRVSARRTPLCDLRSPALLCAVCLFRSSLLSLCWCCFCRWFCGVLYSLCVLLCPSPLASASALVFSSARSLVAVVCGSGGGIAVGAWSRLWDRRRRLVVAAVGRRRFALLIFFLN